MRLFQTEVIRFWSRRITWITLGLAAIVMVLSVAWAFTKASAEAPADSLDFDPACVGRLLAEYRESGDFSGPFGPIESEADLIRMAQEDMCNTRWQDNDKRFHAVSILGPESDDWSENRRYRDTFRDDVAFGPDGQVIRDIDVSGTIGEDGQPIREAQEPLEGLIPGIAVAFLLIAVVLGASFMGAEYRSGTVENLLLWEPRRPRVLLTKYAAGFVSAFVATALAMGFLSGLLLLLATFRGTFEGVDGRFWIDLVSVIGRAGLVGGAFFVLSMGIATIFKNTTAAVGAILGWFLLTNLFIQLFFKSVRQYELFINAIAFIGEAETPKIIEQQQPWGTEEIWAYSHGYLSAGLFVAVWAGVVALIALVLFNRRDLT